MIFYKYWLQFGVRRAKIILSDEQRSELQSLNRKNSVSQSLVLRANIILLADKLQDNKAVAASLNISVQVIGKWSHRWNDLIAKHSIEECLGEYVLLK